MSAMANAGRQGRQQNFDFNINNGRLVRKALRCISENDCGLELLKYKKILRGKKIKYLIY